jgi:outer membrane protein assembly factor BamB
MYKNQLPLKTIHMKAVLLIFTIPFLSFSQAQNGVIKYNQLPTNDDESVIINDSVFISERKDNRTFYHVSKVGNPVVSHIYNPKVEGVLTLEDDYLYVHMNEKVRKYNRHTNEVLWTTKYGNSNWSPQWEPIILDKYVAAIVDDHIALMEKESGKLILDLKGKGFEDGISLSENYLICTKEGGKTWAVDISTGKTAWSIDVGEEAGYGNVTDNGKIYLPSWDPKFFCLDQKTGKKIWTLNLKEFKESCGSGFEEVPVLVGDKLYAVQSDNGLFIIDKNTGKILENFNDFSTIIDNILLYKDDYLCFLDTDNLNIFSIKENKVIKKVALPAPMRTGINLYGDILIATQSREFKNYPYKKGVVSFDLTEILK